MDTETVNTKTYACEMTVPGEKLCGATGTAEEMWNIGKRHTGGKLVILCGKHARVCRNEPHNMRVFRLSETLRREEEMAAHEEAERQASSVFFQTLKKYRGDEEDGRSRRNSHERGRGGGRTLHEIELYERT